MNEEVIAAAPGAYESFDREAMARLARIATRGRSISEVMKLTGLSRSTLSKLINGNAKTRPKINTLHRLNMDDQPMLLRQMLAACGYPQDIQDDIAAFRHFVDETPVCADAAPERTPWSAGRALAMVLESLETKGYGNRFKIDYRTDGVFALSTGKQDPLLICVPLVLPTPEMVSREVVCTALEQIAKGITWWGLDHTVTLLLTDSPSVFRLLKETSNMLQVMAMAVVAVSEDGRYFDKQHTIVPPEALSGLSGDFPVDLTRSGEK